MKSSDYSELNKMDIKEIQEGYWIGEVGVGIYEYAGYTRKSGVITITLCKRGQANFQEQVNLENFESSFRRPTKKELEEDL